MATTKTKMAGKAGGASGRARTRPTGLAILNDILCGVDGTRTSYEAVRQSASLVGPKGRLSLLTVGGTAGPPERRNAVAQATISTARVRQALNYARRIAQRAGVPVETEVDSRARVADALLERAEAHTLLALGAPSMSRVAQLMIGGAASAAVRELPTALLIARRPPHGVEFAQRIVVASDAGARSDALLEFAIDLSLQRGAELMLLHAAGAEGRFQPTRLGTQAGRVGEALGQRGLVGVVPGRASQVIVEGAAQHRASLVILSSRGLSGLRALGSVSERVIHDAPCSVLVVRPSDLRG